MAQPDRQIDWPGLMRAGLHGLGLQPRDLWAMTPLELMVMLGREAGEAGFSRVSLEALMARFPDQTKHEHAGGKNEQF